MFVILQYEVFKHKNSVQRYVISVAGGFLFLFLPGVYLHKRFPFHGKVFTKDIMINLEVKEKSNSLLFPEIWCIVANTEHQDALSKFNKNLFMWEKEN